MGTILFENDVKMYGTQTVVAATTAETAFENDVKMYGTQTQHKYDFGIYLFENDVKMYGTQTSYFRLGWFWCLRMM